LFGNDYGFEDTQGISPTEREFDRATTLGKPRLIYVSGNDDGLRHPKMRALVRKAGDQLIRRRFGDTPELIAAVNASLVEHLARTGALRTSPFDATACAGATLADISQDKLALFLARAQTNRGYALDPSTPMHSALTHLNLLDAGATQPCGHPAVWPSPAALLAQLRAQVHALSWHRGEQAHSLVPNL